MNQDKQDSAALRVLIADDDSDVRSIVSGIVSLMGFEAIEAESGTQALTICQNQLPDLAILDFMMPGLDGLRLCQEIRKLDGGDILPVIMLTAQDGLDDRVRSLEGGLDDYLTKPFRYQELQARLRALLRVRNLNKELKQRNQDLQEMQERVVAQERQLAARQLAGTAAHQLGQPLSAILLNLHLLDILDDREKIDNALAAIKKDVKRMAEMIEQLKQADASKTESYHGTSKILSVPDKKSS